VEGQVTDDLMMMASGIIQVMVDFTVKMRESTILLVNIVVQVFIKLRESQFVDMSR
jgi:hypothetical protein